MPENTVEIPREALATVAVETWRLAQNVSRLENAPHAVGLRYSIRKLIGALEGEGCSVVNLTGRPYDPGMTVEVLDTEGDSEGTELVVKEMLAPIVLLKDELLAPGQVILERVNRPEDMEEERKGE
jgi:hypothetical protein